jgi:maltooligosyltrehalose synthase
VVAFTRATVSQRLVCAVARLSYRKTQGQATFAIGEVWGDEKLRVPYAGRYRDVLTNRELDLGLETRLKDVFSELPIALLLQVAGRRTK